MNLDVTGIAIVQLDREGKYINEFANISDASFKLSIEPQNIYDVISGKTLRCHDFFFVRKEYYDPTKNYSYKWRKAKRKFLKGQIQKTK